MEKIYAHLSAEERGVIFPMKLENRSSGEIALALQRSRSTISRELRRRRGQSRHQCLVDFKSVIRSSRCGRELDSKMNFWILLSNQPNETHADDRPATCPCLPLRCIDGLCRRIIDRPAEGSFNHPATTRHRWRFRPFRSRPGSLPSVRVSREVWLH
ncbi:helix-turn-helix domain-containing protein [Paraburkholderia sediminicola]